MEIKHIYWFAPYNLLCPSTKYRGKYPTDYFTNSLNVSCDFVYPEKSIKGIIRFLAIYFSVLFFRKKSSLIVIQKVSTNRAYAKALKLLISVRSSYTLYDLDDAEYIRQPKETLEFFMRKCSSISVGSTELEKYALKYNSNVFLQTSPIIEHEHQKEKRNPIINIGWVGDLGNGNEISKPFSHKTSMFSIFFPELSKISFPIKLTLIGVKNQKDIPEIRAYFKDQVNIEVEIPTKLDWRNDVWIYPKITNFDLGISPMNNHLFNKSKSAFKAKQYLSCGIPTAACDVGDNKYFVKHNKNGFIIDPSFSYSDAIHKIAEMTDEEYYVLSLRAIKSRNDYSMKKYCSNILTHFRN